MFFQTTQRAPTQRSRSAQRQTRAMAVAAASSSSSSSQLLASTHPRRWRVFAALRPLHPWPPCQAARLLAASQRPCRRVSCSASAGGRRGGGGGGSFEYESENGSDGLLEGPPRLLCASVWQTLQTARTRTPPSLAQPSPPLGSKPHSSITKKTAHYEALGVAHSSTAAEIKASFRKLALRLHPDVCSEVGCVCVRV